MTDSTKSEFLAAFYNKTLTEQCVNTFTGAVTTQKKDDCLSLGTCRTNTTNLAYPITTQSSCTSTNAGVCEVCDDLSCFKLPLGDYCQITDLGLQSYQVCQENYGYNWSDILGTCYLPTFSESECYCGTGLSNYTSCVTGNVFGIYLFFSPTNYKKKTRLLLCWTYNKLQ